jgi:hypothetical protein
MIIKMAKKLNARELDEKELAETKGGFFLLTILLITYLVYELTDTIVDASMTYCTGRNCFD